MFVRSARPRCPLVALNGVDAQKRVALEIQLTAASETALGTGSTSKAIIAAQIQATHVASEREINLTEATSSVAASIGSTCELLGVAPCDSSQSSPRLASTVIACTPALRRDLVFPVERASGPQPSSRVCTGAASHPLHCMC